MAKNGLLINYQYCTGCHSCEVACKNVLKLPRGQWGIKLLENGPWEVTPGKFEWDYIPTPTQLCDLCADRVAEGKKTHLCPSLSESMHGIWAGYGVSGKNVRIGQ